MGRDRGWDKISSTYKRISDRYKTFDEKASIISKSGISRRNENKTRTIMKEKLNIEGLDKNAAITAFIEGGYGDFKAATEFWVENRPERGSGFKARFYALLIEGPMDSDTFEALIVLESENIRKHISAHNSVRETANEIWAAKK